MFRCDKCFYKDKFMDQSESEVRVGLTKSASLHSKKFFKMQKLPSVGLIVGFTILALSVILGWIVIPKVIDNKISQVGLKTLEELFKYSIIL